MIEFWIYFIISKCDIFLSEQRDMKRMCLFIVNKITMKIVNHRFHVYIPLRSYMHKFLRDYKALQVYIFIYIYIRIYVEDSATPLEAFHAWERRAWLSVPVASDLDWTSRSNDRTDGRSFNRSTFKFEAFVVRRRISRFRGSFIVFIVPYQSVLYLGILIKLLSK